ncbi:MAG TPA: hypothetical protein VGR14_00635 [Verrucomicrobiae bacterium]|nr:hypothetical protein [Verrucomicrobiae bacterium]
MTIADAIFNLQHLQKQHGDMPVLISDGVKEYEITEFGAMWKAKDGDLNQMEGHAKISVKNSGPKVIAYARDGNVSRNAPYAQKFAGLIKLIAEAKKDGSEVMVIAEPWVIGDAHEELIESLSRLAGTNIGLIIVHRKRVALNNQN